MNYEQKFKALCALCETTLRMRNPGDWYVSAMSREISENGMLIGEYGNGSTPEEAINDDFKKIAESGKRIKINAMRENPRVVTWNGFMWEDAK